MSTHLPDLAAPAGAAVHPRPRRWSPARWGPLPVLMAATFMFVLDFFIVNVALPAIQADLGAGASSVEWVVAGYGLALAVGLITAGRLGDRYGRRRMFTLGLLLFTVASAACGLAPDAPTLVVARIAQGLAASLLSPQILAIIGVGYAGPARAKALGVYGMVMGLAAAGGQLIGGALVDLDLAGLSWRACFLINVPVGAAALLLSARTIPESRAPRPERSDLVGAALVAATVTAIVLPLVEGRQLGWPLWTWLTLAAAAPLGLTFVRHQRALGARGGDPLLRPALFRERAVCAGLTAQFALWCGQASGFVVLALYLQQGRGLSALDAGLVFTILAAAYLLASAKAPALLVRHGRRLIVAGGLELATGHVLLATAVAAGGTQTPLPALVPGLVAVGLGMGLLITPLVSTILGGVTPQHAGATSGALSTVQQIGGAVGVALVGVVYFGARDGGAGHAFQLSEWLLAAFGLAVAELALLLPRPAPDPQD